MTTILDTEGSGVWAAFPGNITLCAICDEPIADPDDPDLCHWGHEEDCPNLTDPDAGIICACDINYHPVCCPVCNGPEEESEEE